MGKKVAIQDRKLIFGFGVNDADYQVRPRFTGGQKCCLFFLRWQNMLRRCYCPKYQKKHPTYIGCKVCEEWKSFLAFKAWMQTQDWEGKDLDKDLLGGKTYSPDTCLFIHQSINKFTTDRKLDRGVYPLGVYLIPAGYNRLNKDRYRAQINTGKDRISLGGFDTPEEAHQAWLVAKKELCVQLIAEQTDPRVAEGLRRYMEKLT